VVQPTDADGENVSAFETSRRKLLAGASGVAAMAAFPVSGGAEPIVPEDQASVTAGAVNDVEILNFALTLEHLENEFDKQQLQKFHERDFQRSELLDEFGFGIRFTARDGSLRVQLRGPTGQRRGRSRHRVRNRRPGPGGNRCRRLRRRGSEHRERRLRPAGTGDPQRRGEPRGVPPEPQRDQPDADRVQRSQEHGRGPRHRRPDHRRGVIPVIETTRPERPTRGRGGAP
jgi:hypothetical protein